MQITAVIQGHRFCNQWSWKGCMRLVWILNILPHILHCGGLLVQLSHSTGGASLQHMHWEWTPKFATGKFGRKKLKTSLYRVLQTVRCLEPFRSTWLASMMDRQHCTGALGPTGASRPSLKFSFWTHYWVSKSASYATETNSAKKASVAIVSTLTSDRETCYRTA